MFTQRIFWVGNVCDGDCVVLCAGVVGLLEGEELKKPTSIC